MNILVIGVNDVLVTNGFMCIWFKATLVKATSLKILFSYFSWELKFLAMLLEVYEST